MGGDVYVLILIGCLGQAAPIHVVQIIFQVQSMGQNNHHIRYTKLYFYLMEDSENTASTNFEKELKNISTLQERINQTKKELNLLIKIENNETKNIQEIFKQTLLTTRNKLNFFKNHQLIEQHHENLSNDLRQKQDKIKEMRTKEEKQLKDAKEMMKKTKQEERNLIRNNSLKHNEMIKRNRQLDQELKQKLVNQMKKEKENYKQSLLESRLKQSKLKQVKLFNQTLAKIERQPTLQKELERLTREKQMIESKVKDKKILKLQLKEGVDKLKRMEKNEVAQLITEGDQKQFTKRTKTYEHNPIENDLNHQLKLIKSIESIDNVLPLIPEAKLELG